MDKSRKNRINKNNSLLKKTITIEPNEYYKTDNNKHLNSVQAQDVKINGVSFGTTMDMLEKEINDNVSLRNTIKGAIFNLTSTLIEYGYHTSNVELNDLVADILQLKIIHPKKTYDGFKIVNGYIVSNGYDVIIEKMELPDDIYNGYWKCIDDKLVLDNDKFKEIWSALL